MPSFQIDYESKGLDTNNNAILNAVNAYKTSNARREMLNNYRYYKGDNVFIESLKKYYYSDKEKRVVENKYSSNYKSPYGIFHDVVSQKVSTILNEPPTITAKAGKSSVVEENILDEMGYALKQAGKYASIEGEAYIFEDYQGKFTVIRRSEGLAYYDDITNEMRAFLRFWDITSQDGTISKTIVERYTQTGLSRYEISSDNEIKETMKETPYQFKTKVSALTEEKEAIDIGMFPIVKLSNDEDSQSDMTNSLKHKIDAIDLVNSGFLNNIEDFSDAFWVIKDGSGMTSDQYEDFIAYINQTRKMIVNGDENNSVSAEPKQLEIPTAARTTYVDARKKEITIETGIIDTETLTGSSLTTTAIKAAALRLKQRVSDFEWFVHEATKKLVYLYQAYNNKAQEFTVDFTFMLIENETEIITNANSIRPNISEYSYLSLLKRAGYIDSVEEELKRLEEESNERLADIDINKLLNSNENNPQDNPTDNPEDNPGDDPSKKEPNNQGQGDEK